MSAIDLTHEQEQGGSFEEEAPVLELDPSAESEGVDELVAEIEATADDFRVTDFKCAKCGLAHGHDTDKHRASDGFSMTHEEAADMEFNPNCHCGYNELAHRGRSEYGVRDSPSAECASDTAPVPSEVQRQLRS